MAKFLTTNRISAELEDIIRLAQDDIMLISPYLKVNQRLQDFIQDADRRRVRFTLIYGKQDMNDSEWSWIERLTAKEICFVENLHAKCYLNESRAIITSMNLYEFSQQNNDEMGMLVTRAEEPELFRQIYDEAQRLRRNASLSRQGQGKPTGATTSQPTTGTRTMRRRTAEPSRVPKVSGHCIRCGEPIDFDANKPLCGQCYQIWARYADPDYAEKYCHRCGKEKSAISMGKPLCLPCFRQADKLPF